MSMLQKTITSGSAISYPSQWYYADTNFVAKAVTTAADRYTLQSPDSIQVDVGGTSLTQYSKQTLDLSLAASWDTISGTNYTTAVNRAGLDFYVYAVARAEGSIPKLLLSANATYPAGYDALTSRKIAGFHCECLSVGTISGHPLTGYLTGDILPTSVWDLQFKSAASYGNVGQVYNDETQEWCGIYPTSGSVSVPTIVYGGTILVNTDWNNAVDAGKVLGMKLPTDAGFQSLAAGSNEQTNIYGSAAPSPFTSIGYVDTASRRMISDIGCEGCCGLIYSWLDEQSYCFDAAAAHTHAVSAAPGTSGVASADVAPAWEWLALSGSKGSIYKQGTYGDVKMLAGGYWNSSSSCGSRCRSLNSHRWDVASSIGFRLVANSIKK
jgi:hypothetical protein